MTERPYLYTPGVVAEAQAIFAGLLGTVDWDTRMRARKTASFGAPYNYSQMSYPAAPFPPLLEDLVRVVKNVYGLEANNCLLNLYEDGLSSMGWHTDASTPMTPGTGVAILSLGSAREIRFRSIADRANELHLVLEPGSLLYLPPDSLSSWQHSIPAAAGVGPRISATFRDLSDA